MPLQQVRCVGMTEAEIDRAAEILGKRREFSRSGFNVYGYAENEDIQALEAAGLIVERIPAESTIGWLEPAQLPKPLTRAGLAPESPYAQLAKSGQPHFVIQFTGPLTDSDRRILSQMGVRLAAYVPDFAYKATLADEQRPAVESLGFVTRVVPFDAAMTLRRGAIRSRQPKEVVTRVLIPAVSIGARLTRVMRGIVERFTLAGRSDTVATPAPVDGWPSRGVRDEAKQLMFHVRCHDPLDLPAVAEVLSRDSRVIRVAAGRNRIRLWTSSERAQSLQADVAELPQVSVVEPFEYPMPLSSFARQGLAIDVPGQPAFSWTGRGQLVGVVDSGIDSQHPDLKSRLKKLIERVPPEAADDPLGHGTHVCSIIAGDGTASGRLIRGIAPDSNLVVQSIRDRDGIFSGVPVDMGDLFQEAYSEGVRVCNLSWGFRGASFYTTDSYELDKFVYDHPDFLIVVAAGNEGQQPDPLDPADAIGRIGYSSISVPATSKNSISVGACCSPRTDGPYQGKTWKSYQGRLPSPRAPLVAQEPINGDPDCLAAFSSRGPTDDERVKPDLVVPGTVILGARSDTSTPRFTEAKYGGHYTYESGTSMAAPVLAGAAALVREYYVTETHQLTPSAALLKATLINGCDWIARSTAEDPDVGQPNFHQGFGRLDLRKTLPIPGDASGLGLRFVDISLSDPDTLNSAKPSKAAWKKRIQVDSGSALRITLCWTDYPAHGLQNNLDLLIQAPTGQRFIGNPNLRRGPWAKMDRFNNVERIDVADPAPGIWTVMVIASNTPFPPQGFSLVAMGKALSDFF